MQLHALLADEAHGLAQLHLGPRQCLAAFGLGCAQLECGVVAHAACQLQLHLHVGHAVAQRLEGGDGHAELLALVHVLHGHGQEALHHAHAFGAGAGDAHVHGVGEGFEALGGDEGGGRVVELDVGSARFVLREVAARADALGRALDQEQRQLAVQHGGHDEGIGLVAGGDDVLQRGHCVTGAGLAGLGFADVEPVAGLALLVRQHHQRVAAGDPGQPGGLHLVGRVGIQHGAADQRLGQWLQHDALAQLFHDHHGLHRTHAHAAVFVAHVQAGQAQLGQFAVGRAVEAAGRHDLLAALEVVGLVHPAVHGFTQGLLVVGKIEIHGVRLQF